MLMIILPLIDLDNIADFSYSDHENSTAYPSVGNREGRNKRGYEVCRISTLLFTMTDVRLLCWLIGSEHRLNLVQG